MTDRHAGYLVTLSKDIREDDAEGILRAITMIRGVLAVEQVVSENVMHQIAGTRRDSAWRGALLHLAKEGPGEATGVAR